MRAFPRTQTVLHWHGDQFDIPAGAKRLWSSQLCPHQGFCLGSGLGLQFHLELGREHLAELMDKARHERSPPTSSVQDESSLRSHQAPYAETLRVMEGLLEGWISDLMKRS